MSQLDKKENAHLNDVNREKQQMIISGGLEAH